MNQVSGFVEWFSWFEFQLLLSLITQAFSQLRPASIEKVKKLEHRIGQSYHFATSASDNGNSLEIIPVFSAWTLDAIEIALFGGYLNSQEVPCSIY
jgi:hypothetical protein